MTTASQTDTPTRLTECPDKPNCVNSLDEQDRHAIEPIRFTGSADSAIARMKLVISSMEGATIRQTNNDYLHAEFKSKLFGFVDDLELLVDEVGSRFHIRSASRSGYYDFGANRDRVEALRKAFSAAGTE